MARATSGLGQFRGKVGSVVFRVSQGQQIASAYQPAVRNPKSNLQTAQRNKMHLASQLSKLVPREDIIGLAPKGSVRDRRSMFIKNIIENTTSTLTDGVFTSSINSNNVLFSQGGGYEGLSVSGGQSGEFTITFNKNIVSEELFNRTAIKVVQLVIVNNIASGYKSSWVDLGEYDTSSETSFGVDLTITMAPGANYIFFIPVIVAENVRYSKELKSLIQADGNNIVITGEYAVNNAVLKWFRNSAIGPFSLGEVPPVVPPTGSGDEVVNPGAPDFPNIG